MRKVYRYLLVILVSFMVITNQVVAAGYSVTTTSNTVTVGNTVTLNIKGSDVAGKFTISTSNASVVSISSGSVWVDNNTQSITLKANKVGSAVITIVPTDVSNYSGGAVTGNKTITITVKNKPTSSGGTGSSGGSGGSSSGSSAPKPKSSNSYLSSITIDGYDLDSKFDKETLEYTATIKEGTEKIKINAQLADSRAKVIGTGEVEVSEGLNTFNLVVTAENGSKRTYVLKVTVKEYQPINVQIDNKGYTVVRKRKDLPKISEYFKEKEVKIGTDSVEGYYNEELKYVVVGLKDKTGKVHFALYNDGLYTFYNEQVFNGMVLQILDKEIDSGYRKTSFSYNDTVIDSYQEVKLDILKNTYALDNNEITGNHFYLFYAINLETGKEELYQYDAVEKTVQRYNTLVLDMYKERSDRYYLYLLCSILALGLTIILFSIIIICSGKKRKKRKVSHIEETMVEDTSDRDMDTLEESSINKDDLVDEEVPVSNNKKKNKKKKNIKTKDN